MSMWFFDEARELDNYQALREEIRVLEKEYLEIRVILRDAQAALRAAPHDAELQAKVKYYQKRLKGLEAKNPRLAAEYCIEMALFAPPHG
ncbi:MAG: hypothetical protein AB1491_02595 [Thermodesulfobacteriota bacterium]